MSTLFIGDVHGCYSELKELLDKASHYSYQETVFLGDLINKGPDSASVVKLARSLNAKCILGNHEWGLIQQLKSNELNTSAKALKDTLSPEDMNWLTNLPLFIDKDYLAVHGGLKAHLKLSEQRPLDLIKLRELPDGTPWFRKYKTKKPVFFGHWARLGLMIDHPFYCLDGGCVYGRKLVGYIWPDNILLTVPAKATYQKIALAGKTVN